MVEFAMSTWYFAYGSNLSAEQVVRRTGPFPKGAGRARIACLPDYRVVFNMKDGPGDVFANIMPGGDGVIGVLYWLTTQALDRMDQFERGYARQRVRVLLETGEPIDAVTYVALPANVVHGGAPTAAYLDRIVRGAREHGLPEAYIRRLQNQIANENARRERL